MAKRPTPQEVEALLQGTLRLGSRWFEVFKALPEDVNPELAARAALSLIQGETGSPWHFARTCRRLPVPIIRALVEQLEADRSPHSFFLREYLPHEASESELAAAWDEALQALLGLDTTYGWGSKQRRAKLQALAASPSALQAIQTAAVACEEVSLDMLAVLAADGSDASLDALIPHVERAVRQQDWELERLQSLRTHAKPTPAMDAMFARMQALIDARQARSPALQVARALGFGEVDTFWFRVYVTSPSADGTAQFRHHAHLSVDSRSATWFSFSVSMAWPEFTDHQQHTTFDSDRVLGDGLRVGTCQPVELPAWLARAAEKFGVPWRFDQMSVSTSLRGKKRTQLERWLRGGA
ncbi:hypothetical protein ACLESO_25625 [Pyxidicoccus sp. 3LG]